MDIRLEGEMDDEELVLRLGGGIASGNHDPFRCRRGAKPGEIATARYRLMFSGGGEAMQRFIAQKTIPAEKRTKKGVMKTLDLKLSAIGNGAGIGERRRSHTAASLLQRRHGQSSAGLECLPGICGERGIPAAYHPIGRYTADGASFV